MSDYDIRSAAEREGRIIRVVTLFKTASYSLSLLEMASVSSEVASEYEVIYGLIYQDSAPRHPTISRLCVLLDEF